MSHMLIIGGSDAGVSAALRIRELDPTADVTMLVADSYPGYSICGLPFLLSGEVADWRTLAHHDLDEFSRRGIRLLLEHRAEGILPERKVVRVSSPHEGVVDIAYDRLLIATGAESSRPPIEGLDQDGVFLLRTMEDGFAVQRYLEQVGPQRAIVVGGGYIGLEMADGLTRSGLTVTLLEFAPEVLTTLDPTFGALIRSGLESHGVSVITGTAVQRIQHGEGGIVVHTASGESMTGDLVLIAAGVRPASHLALSAGISAGVAGAIRVDRTMATGVPDVWAAGDCVETWHHMLQANVYIPLGTTAHKQGLIAGENMLGGTREFQGTLGTQVVKVFDLAAAGTGLRETQSTNAGYEPLTITMTALDHNPYYPEPQEMTISVTGDINSRRLLGAQIVGHHTSQIAKRIDIVASALFAGLRVDDLAEIDLSYTPPLSTPWDPVQKAAMQWCSDRDRRSGTLS